MKQKVFTLFMLMITALACKNNKENKPPDAQAAGKTVDSSTFYDVKGFFLSEIKDVSTTPYFLYSITTQDEKKRDSAHVTTTTFVQLAQEFLAQDITQKELKPFYKEDIFRDLSTKSITFSYGTKNKNMDVQNIEVLVDEETNKVNFVFIRTQNVTKDSTIITQLNWKRSKNFLINRAVIKSDGSKHSTQQFVSWNND